MFWMFAPLKWNNDKWKHILDIAKKLRYPLFDMVGTVVYVPLYRFVAKS